MVRPSCRESVTPLSNVSMSVPVPPLYPTSSGVGRGVESGWDAYGIRLRVPFDGRPDLPWSGESRRVGPLGATSLRSLCGGVVQDGVL